jgi:hypothetical protein
MSSEKTKSLKLKYISGKILLMCFFFFNVIGLACHRSVRMVNAQFCLRFLKCAVTCLSKETVPVAEPM